MSWPYSRTHKCVAPPKVFANILLKITFSSSIIFTKGVRNFAPKNACLLPVIAPKTEETDQTPVSLSASHKQTVKSKLLLKR